jgi:hypothetical protein
VTLRAKSSSINLDMWRSRQGGLQSGEYARRLADIVVNTAHSVVFRMRAGTLIERPRALGIVGKLLAGFPYGREGRPQLTGLNPHCKVHKVFLCGRMVLSDHCGGFSSPESHLSASDGCPQWVNRVASAVGQPLPVHPDQRTFAGTSALSNMPTTEWRFSLNHLVARRLRCVGICR